MHTRLPRVSTDLSETDLKILKCLLLSGARMDISEVAKELVISEKTTNKSWSMRFCLDVWGCPKEVKVEIRDQPIVSQSICADPHKLVSLLLWMFHPLMYLHHLLSIIRLISILVIYV